MRPVCRRASAPRRRRRARASVRPPPRARRASRARPRSGSVRSTQRRRRKRREALRPHACAQRAAAVGEGQLSRSRAEGAGLRLLLLAVPSAPARLLPSPRGRSSRSRPRSPSARGPAGATSWTGVFIFTVAGFFVMISWQRIAAFLEAVMWVQHPPGASPEQRRYNRLNVLSRIRQSLALKLILASAIPSAVVLLAGPRALAAHSHRLSVRDPAVAVDEVRAGGVPRTLLPLPVAR